MTQFMLEDPNRLTDFVMPVHLCVLVGLMVRLLLREREIRASIPDFPARVIPVTLNLVLYRLP